MNGGRNLGMLGLLLLLAGCGGQSRLANTRTQPDAGADAGSDAASDTGTDAQAPPVRLAPWQLESAGMPPMLLGIYDTQRQVHCEFMADSAGNLRCLPLVPEELPDHNQFADASCKTRIFSGAVFASASSRQLVSIPLSGATPCVATRHIVGVLAPLAVGTAHYTADGQGGCVSSTFVPDEPEVVLANLSDPEQWVSGVETAGVRLGGRLHVREVETPDGARFPIGLFDERWGEPCSNAGDGRCWPNSSLGLRVYYTDPACESKVWGTDRCVTPPFEADGENFFTLLPYRGPLFEGGGLGCFSMGDSTTGASDRSYFTSQSELTQPDVLAAPKQAYHGGGRFEHLTLEDDQGQPVTVNQSTWPAAEPAFQDRTNGKRCLPVWTPSGVRCLPDTVRLNADALLGFADENCREPAYYCPETSCDGQVFAPSFESVQGHFHVAALKRAKDIGSAYWTRVEGICTLGTLPLVYYRADGEVPWDEYPALDESNAEP